MSRICPFCEVGLLKTVIYSEPVKVGRRTVDVAGMQKSVCPECGEETVLGEMHDANSALVAATLAHRSAAVTRGALRRLRESYCLTQREASTVFGAGASSFAKWESGQVPPSTPSALLVQCAARFPEVMVYLAQLADVEICPATKAVPTSTGWYSSLSDLRVWLSQPVMSQVPSDHDPANMKFMPPRRGIDWGSDWNDLPAVKAANGAYFPALEAA